MRKIVAGLFISLDGVVESPRDWHFAYFNDEMGEVVGTAMAASDTMLLGRRTYEEFAGYWPNAAADDPMAAQLNGKQKFVVSTTLESADWQNSTLIKENVAEELRRLKAGPGGTIGMTGSGTLVRSLLRDGLLDELMLILHPVVVGKGKRLFDDMGAEVPLTLANSRPLSNGVVVLTYVPAQAQAE